MAKWTDAQIELAEKWYRLIEEERDAESYEIRGQIERELGPDNCSALLEYIEERHEKPKPKVFKFSKPNRAAQSEETWRFLDNYPLYQVSSHGRVRCNERAKSDDFLKPRWRWRYGMGVPFVVIRDRDGKRCERMIPKLLIAAGFMPQPEWMQKKASVE